MSISNLQDITEKLVKEQKTYQDRIEILEKCIDTIYEKYVLPLHRKEISKKPYRVRVNVREDGVSYFLQKACSSNHVSARFFCGEIPDFEVHWETISSYVDEEYAISIMKKLEKQFREDQREIYN